MAEPSRSEKLDSLEGVTKRAAEGILDSIYSIWNERTRNVGDSDPNLKGIRAARQGMQSLGEALDTLERVIAEPKPVFVPDPANPFGVSFQMGCNHVGCGTTRDDSPSDCILIICNCCGEVMGRIVK